MPLVFINFVFMNVFLYFFWIADAGEARIRRKRDPGFLYFMKNKVPKVGLSVESTRVFLRLSDLKLIYLGTSVRHRAGLLMQLLCAN